jgi:hypothetical protein
MKNEPAFKSFLAGCQDIVDDASLVCKPNIVVRGGIKWIAIDSKDTKGPSESVFCFIAAQDGCNRGMGKWKRGDVMKPAGYNKPAKHARGNIFDNDNGLSCIEWTGPAYLK